VNVGGRNSMTANIANAMKKKQRLNKNQIALKAVLIEIVKHGFYSLFTPKSPEGDFTSSLNLKPRLGLLLYCFSK
jgi:hypothetical protein